MSLNVNYDMDGTVISITINNQKYSYIDECTTSIPMKAFYGQDIKALPFNLPVGICDAYDNNTIIMHGALSTISQESDGVFKVMFEESATRKYWDYPVNLELWMEITRNVVSKLYNAEIDNYDDDGAYIHFSYSLTINASSFEELFKRIDKVYCDINAATDIAITSPPEKLEYRITNQLRFLRKSISGKSENSLEYQIYKKELTKIIEKHLKENNPDKLLKEYKTFFSDKNFPKKTIKKGERFYRGRIGYVNLPGAIDDCNWDFVLPYHEKNIDAPPPLYTSGGRFNRAGVSYLYLATDLETCLAEVHLQVGQFCSIAEFECVEDLELINLSEFTDDLELKIWCEEITQPVHEEIKYKYFITQFMSDVFMQFNGLGLYFKSVQSKGSNIVCFQPDKFKLVKYSEKLYKAQKISYQFSQVEDAIREFANRDDVHLLNSYNSNLDDENERQMDYMLDWIKHEKRIKK